MEKRPLQNLRIKILLLRTASSIVKSDPKIRTAFEANRRSKY